MIMKFMLDKNNLSERKANMDEAIYQQLVQAQSLVQLLRTENEHIISSFTWKLACKFRSIIEKYNIIYRFVHSVANRFVRRDAGIDRQKDMYKKWIQKCDCLNAEDRRAIKDHIRLFEHKPRFSVLFFLNKTLQNRLECSLKSILHQLYPHWDILIVYNSSETPDVLNTIEKAILLFKDHPQSIKTFDMSGLNRYEYMLDHVKGEYIVFFHSGDILSLHALYMLALAVNLNKRTDIIYSDEDFISQNEERFAPYFKPDWNPDLFLSRNYIHNLCSIRLAAINREDEYFNQFNEITPYNLLLNVIGNTQDENINHLPFVLYHNFLSSQISRKTEIEQEGFQGDFRALSRYFSSKGINASIEQCNKKGDYRIHYPLSEPSPLISIIIPTAGNNMRILTKLVVDLIQSTSYEPIEILVIANNVNKKGKLSRIKAFEDYEQVKVLHYKEPFNHSAINNWAVRSASGRLLCFMNDDMKIIHPDWLTEMVEQALRSEIGAVGAKLYYPNNLIQHAGLILGCGGAASHIFRWLHGGDRDYFWNADFVRNYSAVTAACMVMRNEIFDIVNGFEEDLPVAFNDVDLCLKIREKGFRILYTPYAELYHHESLSSRNMISLFSIKVRDDMKKLQNKWASELIADPAFNPNLCLMNEIPTIIDVPKINKPWESCI